MTTHSQPLQGYLYHSQIAPHADIACVADIVKTARSFNKSQGITGLLVFDGQRFCQYLEGPEPALESLLGGIARDPRHVAFTPLHRWTCEGQRQFANWSMAYVLIDDAEPLAAVTTTPGPNALDRLQRLLPLMDIA